MKTREKRLIKILKAILSVIWVILGVVGMIYGVRGIRRAGDAIDQAIGGIHITTEEITSLLTETMDVFELVDQSLSTVEKSTIDAAIAMGGTTPLDNRGGCYQPRKRLWPPVERQGSSYSYDCQG